MPHRVLQVVAAGLVLVSVSAFAMGVINAPSRGRMPGERVAGGAATAGGAAVNATDAVPLAADRIEGLAPRELTDEEKEKLQEAKEAKAEADAEAKAAAETATPPAINPPPPSAVPTEAPPASPPDEAPH
ncbi:MAG: hypothetical protein JSR98_14925 [Proteobacteria bacterium]|nr:hypothetical protein [Pseudomonadota bacterium]